MDVLSCIKYALLWVVPSTVTCCELSLQFFAPAGNFEYLRKQSLRRNWKLM